MPSPFQRVLSKKQLAKLALIAGPNGTGWRTRDFENAVYIAVDPQLLNMASLTHNPYGPYQRVEWTAAAKQATMTLVAGAHRQSVSIKLVEPQRRSIEKAEQAIAKLDPVLRADAIAEHRRHIRKCNEATEPRRVWLAMLYDQGMCCHHLAPAYPSNTSHQKSSWPCNPTRRWHS